MTEPVAPALAVGALALALAILYAAWHEVRAKNPRDAKVLASLGAISLVGSLASWLH